jgi:predicted DNA-binding transcriptional regulator YafY
MPVNKAAQLRYEIIDECLRNIKRKWTKSDLLQFVNRRLALEYGEGTGISASQLRYDLESMQTACGAPIEMYRDGKKYLYRYEDPEFSIKNIPIEHEDIIKLNDAIKLLQQIKGFTIAEEMADIVHRLEHKYHLETEIGKPAISFESSPEMQGTEHLEDIYHAIIRKNVLKITYQTFNAKTSRIWNIHPYLLKEYNNRWYLVGHSEEKQCIGIFALDRMKEIKIARMTFLENNLNGDEYFKDIIGVTLLPGQKAEDIELSFSRYLAPYIQSKPLHHSQETISVLDGGTLQIKLKLCINPELVSMLLSYGKDLKVLKPAHLSAQMRQIAKELALSYE